MSLNVGDSGFKSEDTWQGDCEFRKNKERTNDDRKEWRFILECMNKIIDHKYEFTKNRGIKQRVSKKKKRKKKMGEEMTEYCKRESDCKKLMLTPHSHRVNSN